jgi:hypothetical protein
MVNDRGRTSRHHRTRKYVSGRRYIATFLRDCGVGGRLLRSGLSFGPICSVNCGGAGIALALCKLGCDQGDQQLLSLAERWIARTIQTLDQPEAFHDPERDFTEATLGKVSILHKESGVRWVQAVIARNQKQRRTCRRAVNAFLRVSRLPSPKYEFSFGKGGLLVGCALLIELLADFDADLCDAVRKRGKELHRQMVRRILEQHRFDSSAFRQFLGAAHGRAGILHSLLIWYELSGSEIHPGLRKALKNLAGLAEKRGPGIVWPRVLGGDEYWSGWCNGSAGFVFLFSLASRMLSEPSYLKLAAAAAEYTWRVRNPDASLCCGATGDGYAFLNLYRATGNKLWLQRARRSAEAALNVDRYNYSLFVGKAGVVALLSDLERPEGAWMPLFERAPTAAHR